MQSIEQLALNVWDDEDRGWLMAIYPVTADGTDTSKDWSFRPTREQVIRYLKVSEDSDWWVYSLSPDFHYILTGNKHLQER